MATAFPSLKVTAFLVLGFSTACGLGDPFGTCVEGQQIECPCGNGVSALQVCNASGAYGACSCPGAVSDAGAGGLGGGTGGGLGGGAGGGLGGGAGGAGGGTDGGSPSHDPAVQSVVLPLGGMELPSETATSGTSSRIQVNVMLSDPDGVTNLAQAGIVDVVSGKQLASIALPANGAGTSVALTTSISSQDLNAASPISFPVGGGMRVLEVVVRDRDNHETRVQFQLPLSCRAPAEGACNGLCTDFRNSLLNCGACGVSIPVSLRSNYWCVDGVRQGLVDGAAGQSCDQACAGISGRCRPNPAGALPDGVMECNTANYYVPGGAACAGLSPKGRRLVSCAEVAPATVSCGTQSVTCISRRCVCLL